MFIIKRDGTLEQFNWNKIDTVITKAFHSVDVHINEDILSDIKDQLFIKPLMTVEDIQDQIEDALFECGYQSVGKAFLRYRDQHKDSRELLERLKYMNDYADSSDNAATASETDANANVTMKNVATLEGEVYKVKNRNIQRLRMKLQLNEQFPDDASLGKQYIRDLEHHIIYTHDEATSPTLKFYCQADSLYPLMMEGVGNMDGVTPSAPNDLKSFSGQLTNAIFLLSSQCKGAVAVGEYFVVLNHYVIAEFGEDWYNHLEDVITTKVSKLTRTVRDAIYAAFKQFVWGINQPAGNRGFQSPFTNISYFDKTYFEALFKDFYYPDGTRPEWHAIDVLQRLFMKWFNALRLKQVLAFPVETFAMVHDGTDIIDKEYKELCAEMYAEGHSFFTYISDSADSLASCCRLRNSLTENTFSPTSGLTGIMTGSCNVITLNINRIAQDWAIKEAKQGSDKPNWDSFKVYLIDILERVYKYHIAFKTMLYDAEEKGMFSCCNAGYIHMNKLYSTIGINGLNEAARFFGFEVSNNLDYIKFLQLILGTIKEQNKIHSIHDKNRPILFNSECVPAESLGGKNYNWDKDDGYWVPEDENLYNSYFYNAHDHTSVLDKFVLHGRQTSSYCDGGSAAHINLQDHLSKAQYLHLIDYAIEVGTNYFTFNIPNTKCKDCGHIVKKPVDKCPKCGSTHLASYTRIIGYLRPIEKFGEDRQIEAGERYYGTL